MFQLDDAMREWRTCMVQQGTTSQPDMDELESHLRDDIEQLVDKDLSVEEAYLVGIHRLGAPPELSAEFGKINGARVWTRRLLWMLSGYLAIGLILSLYAAAVQWVSAGAMISGLVGSSSGHLVLRGAMLVMGLLAVMLLGFTPGGRDLLMRSGDRILFWGRHHPGMLLTGAFVLYAGIRIAGFGRSLLLARAVGVESFGQEALAAAYVGFAMAVIVPAGILFLLGLTYRNLHHPAKRRLSVV